MNPLKEILLKTVLGHGTQVLGGALITHGLGTENDAQAIIGVALSGIAAGLSALRKWRRARKAAKAAK